MGTGGSLVFAGELWCGTQAAANPPFCPAALLHTSMIRVTQLYSIKLPNLEEPLIYFD